MTPQEKTRQIQSVCLGNMINKNPRLFRPVYEALGQTQQRKIATDKFETFMRSVHACDEKLGNKEAMYHAIMDAFKAGNPRTRYLILERLKSLLLKKARREDQSHLSSCLANQDVPDLDKVCVNCGEVHETCLARLPSVRRLPTMGTLHMPGSFPTPKKASWWSS